jgi:hypothetical protein
MAYLIRSVIENAGIPAGWCYINGVLALPSVFPTVERTGIQSNAYAALSELDYFTTMGSWTVDFGNPRVKARPYNNTRPFNICYLVDARNEHGDNLAGLEELSPMLAEAIYLQIGSQVGDATRSQFDNIAVLSESATHDDGKERPTAYSSLGTASIVFPVQKIIDLCARRLGRDLVQQHLLRKDFTTERVDAAINGLLQSNQLERDALLQQIARDDKGNLLRVVIDPNRLNQFKDSELAGATQAYLNKAENVVDNDYNLVLDSNRKQLAERLVAALEKEVNRWVDDPVGGLHFTVSILEKLDTVLAAQKGELDKGRAEMDQRRDRAQAQLRQTLDEFLRSFKSNPIGRGGRIKDARNRHVEMHQNYLMARFESKKREVAIALLAGLSTTIQSRRAALQRLIERLQFIQNQYETYLKAYGGGRARTEFVLATDITVDADIERYYSEHFARLGAAPAASLLDAQGPLHDWLTLEQEAVAGRILAHTQSVFDDLREITIEQIVLEKKDLVEPRKRLDELINRSVPFWNYQKESRMGQEWRGVMDIVAVGVPDRETSIYKDALTTGQSLTSTFDLHQITVLQTKHGIPLFALTQFPDFKDSADHVMQRRLKSLYVYPEVRPGGEKSKRDFALGIVYGHIFKSGTLYYVVNLDVKKQPHKLAQGMSESMQVFRNDLDLVKQVSKLVEEQIQREGVDAAQKLIEGFLNEPFVFEHRGGIANGFDRNSLVSDTSVGGPKSVNYDLIQDLRDILKDYVEKVLRA